MLSTVDSIYSGRLWSDVIVPGNTLRGIGVNDNAIYAELQAMINDRESDNLKKKFGDLGQHDMMIGA